MPKAPNTEAARALMPQLNLWVAANGGRIYLAKDALLMAEPFARMYEPDLETWQEITREVDPHARFSSLLSERLGLKPWRR